MKTCFYVILLLIFGGYIRCNEIEAQSLTVNSPYKSSNDTYIAFDLDFQNAGYQDSKNFISNPGPGELFGFAVFLKNNTLIRGFTIDLTWDGSKAAFRNSQSGPNIIDDVYDINGITDVEFAEESNILIADGTGSLFSIVHNDEVNRYRISLVKIGGESATQPGGLLYLAVFRTAADLSKKDLFTITVKVTISDEKGKEYYIGMKEFNVGSGIAPPSNVLISDVPGDSGHSIMLTWTLSPDDSIITHYYIYRSRIPIFSGPVSLDSFTTIEELISAEKNTSLFVGSVPRGHNTYIDSSVPLNNVNYFYWLESVSETAASEKVSAGYFITAVDLKPSGFKLSVPYPNPFNPSTTIEYSLPYDSYITLNVYNMAGQHVAVLTDGLVSTGHHSIVWDASDKPSGIYLIIIASQEFTKTRKMLLMK